jgi:hypothetical protein
MIAMSDVWAGKRKKRDIHNAELKGKYHWDGQWKVKQASHGNYWVIRNIPLVAGVIMGLP